MGPIPLPKILLNPPPQAFRKLSGSKAWKNLASKATKDGEDRTRSRWLVVVVFFECWPQTKDKSLEIFLCGNFWGGYIGYIYIYKLMFGVFVTFVISFGGISMKLMKFWKKMLGISIALQTKTQTWKLWKVNQKDDLGQFVRSYTHLSSI